MGGVDLTGIYRRCSFKPFVAIFLAKVRFVLRAAEVLIETC